MNGKIELNDDMLEEINGGSVMTDCFSFIGKLFLVRLGFAKLFKTFNAFR